MHECDIGKGATTVTSNLLQCLSLQLFSRSMPGLPSDACELGINLIVAFIKSKGAGAGRAQ